MARKGRELPPNWEFLRDEDRLFNNREARDILADWDTLGAVTGQQAARIAAMRVERLQREQARRAKIDERVKQRAREAQAAALAEQKATQAAAASSKTDAAQAARDRLLRKLGK